VNWNRTPDAGLWVISLVNNTETFLGSGNASLVPAGWSPDEGSIYAFHYPPGHSLLSIPVGHAGRAAPHSMLTAPGDIGYEGASVSQDGKTFVFSASETKSDVWVVENFDPAYRK
jgi:hypothetical protein